MKYLICSLCLFLIAKTTFSQEAQSLLSSPKKRIILIQPTGETKEELPEMEILSDTSELYQQVKQNMDTSFISEIIDIYIITQNFLKNIGSIDLIEPAWLSITENQGGFAKFGFNLKKEGVNTPKKDTPYIDITAKRSTGKIDKLMSFSQLYPHEMGHILIHMLCAEDSLKNNTRSVNMHFFSIVTDYSTAINEGFAEHIENVARHYEDNEFIKQGIQSDTENIRKKSRASIKGFKNDFLYPVRLGFYKASMINWYQKFEDYKRFEHAITGEIKYKNATFTKGKLKDLITYRNAGVESDSSEMRNLVQLHATEGLISAFFTRLSISDLIHNYASNEFYEDFYLTLDTIQDPKATFSPLQNQFIKYAYVFHNYVIFNNSAQSQFLDFVKGYVQTFPDESSQVEKIYKELTGAELHQELPPPVWLLVKNYDHRLVTFDPFDAVTIPLYTFDLNAAEVEDLMTITGISDPDAKAIINYRNENGFYTELEDVKKIPGLQKSTIQSILSAKWDQEYLESELENFNSELSIAQFVLKPLQYIYSRALIYFLLFFFGVYWFLFRKKGFKSKKSIGLFFKYLLIWFLLVLLGLVIVIILGRGLLVVVLLIALILTLGGIIYRKNKEKQYRTITFVAIMGILLLISII